MKLDFFILFFFYLVSILSTLGYGSYFQRIVNIPFKKKCLGYSGLIGVFFLTIYSYFSNFFYAHGIHHNLIILFIGLVLFYLSYIKRLFSKKEIKFLVILFSIIFISFLISKTHDDFPYYHFPYTYYLTQNSSLIGIGNFNHGFRTPSSLFYFNSLFYLPIIKYYLFHIGSAIIYGSAIFIFLSNIRECIKKKKINYIYYFDLFSLIFILVFFYRLSEHGTDRSAQILIFLILSEIFRILLSKKITTYEISILSILFSITISLKAFYFLYGLLLFPTLFIILKNDKSKNFLEKIFFNKAFYFSVLLIILVLITNFFNTGCLIYPISISCFTIFDWSIPLKETSQMALHYENWSKAGMTPNFKVEDPSSYVKDFNWINGWFNRYFLYKVSDFLLGLIVLTLVLGFTFYSKKRKKIIFKKEILLIYLTIGILFIEWFINHPTLRYGGFSLIAILFFIPSSIIIESYMQKLKLIKRGTFIIVLVGITIFTIRNIDRIIKENKKYNYNIFTNPYLKVDYARFFRIETKINDLINNYNDCQSFKKECENNNQYDVTKKFNKYIFTRKK